MPSEDCRPVSHCQAIPGLKLLQEHKLREIELFDLPVQRTLADAELCSRLASISLTLSQRRDDGGPFYFSHCHAMPVNDIWRGHRLCQLDLEGRNGALGNLDDLDLAGALVQPAAQLLHLKPKIHEAPKYEFQLMWARSRPCQTSVEHRKDGGSTLQDVRGDIRRADFGAGGQHHHRLDEVAELAHIPGPGGLHQPLHGVGGDTAEGAVVLFGNLADESLMDFFIDDGLARQRF